MSCQRCCSILTMAKLAAWTTVSEETGVSLTNMNGGSALNYLLLVSRPACLRYHPQADTDKQLRDSSTFGGFLLPTSSADDLYSSSQPSCAVLRASASAVLREQGPIWLSRS
jgi:hypothetical protein